MTQEDKELLLKDLCARLSYGVKVNIKHDEFGNLIGIVDAVYPVEERIIVDDLNKAIASANVRCGGFLLDECEIKLYLRPMSSMTEEEIEKYNRTCEHVDIEGEDVFFPTYETVDFCNSNHLDYRGLIEKGLALEAPEGMYDEK